MTIKPLLGLGGPANPRLRQPGLVTMQGSLNSSGREGTFDDQSIRPPNASDKLYMEFLKAIDVGAESNTTEELYRRLAHTEDASPMQVLD